jgi:hypothetical protein
MKFAAGIHPPPVWQQNPRLFAAGITKSDQSHGSILADLRPWPNAHFAGKSPSGAVDRISSPLASSVKKEAARPIIPAGKTQ